MTRPRVIVLGGGIAGVSAGYHLAHAADVVLLERESTLAYHTTGRSAAQYFEYYGAQALRPLTRASREFFEAPPPHLTDVELLTPQPAMMIGRPDQRDALERLLDEERGPGIRWIEPAEAVARCPVLAEEYLVGAVVEETSSDIDVAALHQAFVRGLRAAGGEIRTDAPAEAITHTDGRWQVAVGDEIVTGDVVVNATGAWGDVVAESAGIAPVGLTPLRRTAFMVAAPPEARDTPMVIDIDEQFYFKPDGPQLLCSPAETEPSEPCDARPREIDIAIAIDRINTATTLGIRSVRSSWTGLRTFAPDKVPVIGHDPDHPGFFWLVGQGGTGIQTSPAAGRLAAALALDAAVDASLSDVDLDALSPARFR